MVAGGFGLRLPVGVWKSGHSRAGKSVLETLSDDS